MSVEQVLVLKPVRDSDGATVDAIVEVASESWAKMFTPGRHPPGAALSAVLPQNPYWDDVLRVADTGVPVARVTTLPDDPTHRAELRITRAGEHVLMVTSQDAVVRRELIAAQSLAQVGSWTWDPRTDVAAWSDSMLELYGLPPGSPSPSFAEQARFYDAETIRHTGSLIEQAIRTREPYACEYDLTRADGTVRHVLARGAIVTDAEGQFAGLRGTVVDVTALHDAREALRASEQRFTSVMAALREPVGIVRPMRDADGEVFDFEIEWVNDAWKRIHGWEGRDPTGQRAYGIRPEFATLFPVHRRVLEHGGSERALLEVAGGRWFEIDFTRMGDRLIAVSRDVTELRAALERAAKAEREEAIGRLATGIAHEFNNQLFVIQAHLDCAEEALPDEGGVLEDLAAIREGAARAQELTQTLVSAAQRQLLSPRIFDLVEFVEALLPQIEQTCGEDICVESSFEVRDLRVRIDPERFREAILQLARNARDALASGGGVVTLAVAHETMRCDGHGDEPWVVLRVHDTASNAEAADVAFEAFDETGLLHRLGVWGVAGLIRQSGGFVRVARSEHGTTFAIHLPRARAT